VSGVSDHDAIRIASVNLLDGGLDPDGSDARLQQSAAALRNWEPHMVLAQELHAPGEELVRRQFRSLANALGLEPCALGQPRGSRRLRTGILADTSVVEVIDDGPPPALDAPFWAEAIVRVRATGTVLSLASVHAPATTATGQGVEAERLATRTAQRGLLAVAGGDWNCYTPADGLTEEEVSSLPSHLRPARARITADRVTANYDVHYTLAAVGLTDPVPALPPDRREPPDPPGTGSHPRARIDRFYLWPPRQLPPAVRCYHQKPNPGSDHQIIMICLDPDQRGSERLDGGDDREPWRGMAPDHCGQLYEKRQDEYRPQHPCHAGQALDDGIVGHRADEELPQSLPGQVTRQRPADEPGQHVRQPGEQGSSRNEPADRAGKAPQKPNRRPHPPTTPRMPRSGVALALACTVIADSPAASRICIRLVMVTVTVTMFPVTWTVP
jgi:hypothetical protein